MEFRLNGGPFDGEIVTVAGTYPDGSTISITKPHEGGAVTYTCPSEEDFDNRDLWLCLITLKTPVHSVADHDMLDRWMKDGSYYKNTYINKVNPNVSKTNPNVRKTKDPKRLIELDWEQHASSSSYASGKKGYTTKTKRVV